MPTGVHANVPGVMKVLDAGSYLPGKALVFVNEAGKVTSEFQLSSVIGVVLTAGDAP